MSLDILTYICTLEIITVMKIVKVSITATEQNLLFVLCNLFLQLPAAHLLTRIHLPSATESFFLFIAEKYLVLLLYHTCLSSLLGMDIGFSSGFD